jgi:hypothetical protein
VSAGWIAGSVRARLLLGRRVGREGALRLAAAGTLAEAIALLSATPYGARREIGPGLVEAERAVAAMTLLHLRVLAGWLPPGAAQLMRALGGWFEIASIEDRLAFLLGGELREPFALGSLALGWSAAGRAQSPGELRAALAASAWGDPGGEEPEQVQLALRLAWARRLLAEVPDAHEWVCGALALLLARESLLAGRRPALPVDLALRLGSGWERAATVPAMAAALPREAAWALDLTGETDDLWRAEARWWARVERDAEQMVRVYREGRHVVVGAVALLAADAHRVLAALAVAARGGLADAREVLDAPA